MLPGHGGATRPGRNAAARSRVVLVLVWAVGRLCATALRVPPNDGGNALAGLVGVQAGPRLAVQPGAPTLLKEHDPALTGPVPSHHEHPGAPHRSLLTDENDV